MNYILIGIIILFIYILTYEPIIENYADPTIIYKCIRNSNSEKPVCQEYLEDGYYTGDWFLLKENCDKFCIPDKGIRNVFRAKRNILDKVKELEKVQERTEKDRKLF